MPALIRENWGTTPQVRQLLTLLARRLGVDQKSAVMRMALIRLAREHLGDAYVDQVLEQEKRAGKKAS